MRLTYRPSNRKRLLRDFQPNYDHACENCGSTPTVPLSGLCGPCHFGTAEAVGGGWWNDGDDDFDEAFVDAHM